ncbi:glycosyltransferase [Gemmatimonadota bacterium]
MTDSDTGPSVTALLVVKNGERFISQALESIQAQTYPPEETIVLDGNSSDRSVEIARAFAGVRVSDQIGTGIADAFNQGVREARGDLVAFLSHDDLWEPEKLARQVEFMAGHPAVAITFTRFRYFVEPGLELPPGFNRGLLDRDLVGMIPEAMVARREVFGEVGPFDIDYAVAQDVDWLARARDLGVRMEVVPEILLNKRVHSSNTSADAELNTPLLLRTLRESILRKRALEDSGGGRDPQ